MKTSTLNKISNIIIYSVSIGAIAYGVLYLFRSNIMNYHEAFVGLTETELNNFNPRIVDLMLTFINIIGSTFISVGLASIFITAFFIKKERKKVLIIVILTYTISLIPLLIFTHAVASGISEGGVKPPWWITLVMICLLFLAVIIPLFQKRK